ncbi:MAG TPA: 30S ribosomal protein S3 [Candidatus Portnoybacteria bacterium]|nr:30S ribosomal protein S3 [Candidatus Portnoybacteria bacterium]
MGQKVNPISFRLGIIRDWKSQWFAKSPKKYSRYLAQDIIIRNLIWKRLSTAAVSSIQIERLANIIRVIIYSARPGLVIGRGGVGIEKIKKEVKKHLLKEFPETKDIDLKIDIEEIRDPSADAQIMAQWGTEKLEKRMPYRRVIKQMIDRVSQVKEVKGVKVAVKGRLNGAEIARKEWLKWGQIPLQTLRADVDYGEAIAHTIYGTIGVKVWIYKGEKFK